MNPLSRPPLKIRAFASAYHKTSERWYVISKLATDPLYPAVLEALEGTDAPLLDIGCGMGLFPFYLRARGWTTPLRGIDYDPRKIDTARETAFRLGPDVEFATADARTGLPEHSGTVTILDILQYFQPAEQKALLEAAAARVAPGGRLIIRSGLATDNWRYRLTRFGDRLAGWTRWMRDHAVCYPNEAFLQETLTAAGLTGTIRPLWGRTPFNNWLGVWERKF